MTPTQTTAKSDKGTLVIILTKTSDGKTAITHSGRRRGAPVNDAKLTQLLKEYESKWAPLFGYSSITIVNK